MKMKLNIAAALLVASGVIAAQALAQSPLQKAADAQRLQKLKAQRDAAIAQAKARQNTIQPGPTPTAAPTAAPTPAPTPIAVPTTPPTSPRNAPTATPATTTPAPSASASAKPPSGFSSGAPAASAAPKAPVALSLDLDELKKTRPDRRSAEVQGLKARWGELLHNDQALSELKLHAQRTAYLQRIRALASKANDAKTVQAVDVLITKEDSRDADAMNALRSGALPAPTPAAAPAGVTK